MKIGNIFYSESSACCIVMVIHVFCKSNCCTSTLFNTIFFYILDYLSEPEIFLKEQNNDIKDRLGERYFFNGSIKDYIIGGMHSRVYPPSSDTRSGSLAIFPCRGLSSCDEGTTRGLLLARPAESDILRSLPLPFPLPCGLCSREPPSPLYSPSPLC